MGGKRKAGRPASTWSERDIEQFKSLCAIFCTEAEICSVMGVSDKTLVGLINRYLYEDITGHKQGKNDLPVTFVEAFERYSATGRASLRREQFKVAKEGSTTMLIWLGKQHLNQSERIEQTVAEVPYVVDDIG